jgi:hypothetical protein
MQRIITLYKKIADPATVNHQAEVEVSVDLLVTFEFSWAGIDINHVEDAVFGRVLYGALGNANKPLPIKDMDDIEMKIKEQLAYEKD